MTAFRDAFIEYEPAVVLPPVTIVSEASFGTLGVGIAQVTVTNHATFAYGVQITDVPPWLLSGTEPEPLAPGQSATLRIGIDQSVVPPGETDAAARVTISRPFLRRSYPLTLHASVRYTGPAPRIDDRTVTGPDGRRTLHVTIANAGGGLLQGFCYDRGTGQRKEFLLSGAGEERDAQVLRFSTPVPNEHTGIVVVCDCVNERLRRQELFAAREPPLADAPFIDFLGAPRGTSHEFDLHVHGPVENVAIEVPESLQGFLTFTRVPPTGVRFTLASGSRRPARLADRVTLRCAGVSSAVPILISESLEGSP